MNFFKLPEIVEEKNLKRKLLREKSKGLKYKTCGRKNILFDKKLQNPK